MIRQILKVLNDSSDSGRRSSQPSLIIRPDNSMHNRERKFESVQAILDKFVHDHSQDTFVFPELRDVSESEKEQFFSFLFEVLREEKIAETEILQEENVDQSDSSRNKPRGFWSFFEKRKNSHSSAMDEDESYNDPELFEHLTVLKLTCLKTLRILSRDKLLYQGELGDRIINEENLMVLVRLLRTNPLALDAVIDENIPEPSGANNGSSSTNQPSLLSPSRKSRAASINPRPDQTYKLPEEEMVQIQEAQKCLCNFVYTDARARKILSSSFAPQIILSRDPERFWKVPDNRDLVFFDLRLLFLLTAFDADLRARVMGFGDDSFKDVSIPRLNAMIDYFAKLSQDFTQESYDGVAQSTNNLPGDTPEQLAAWKVTESDVEIVNECLKVLFNLTMVIKRQDDKTAKGMAALLSKRAPSLTLATPDQPSQITRLVSTCRALLADVAAKGFCPGDAKRYELDSNTVNLLTNIPPSYFANLVPAITEAEANQLGDPENLTYTLTLKTKEQQPLKSEKPSPYTVEESQTYDMSAINEILTFITYRFDHVPHSASIAPNSNPTKTNQSLKEVIVPSLLFLTEAAKNVRPIRKYLKDRILPRLTAQDVKELPERGTTLRNRICKLMTSPMLDVKELSAEFLFTLCKENVNKLVRYTGYGNAAGILARLGLMTGGSGPNRSSYSSTDSASDIDEGLVQNINPVTGQWETSEAIAQRENAFSQLTDQEKEERAEEIAKLLKNLKAGGVIQPVAIGKDGRPIPFEQFDETSPPP